MKSDWVVLKFGGTSVASRQGWDVIAGQVRDRLSVNEKPFLVFSAFAGVSDLLEEIFLHNSNKERDLVLDQIACRHQEIAKDLGVDNECYAEMLEILRKKVDKIKDVSPKLKADIFAYGEILSTTIGAEFLKSQIPGTLWIDARDILKAINQEDDTDQRSYLLASCDYEPDEKLQKNSATCIVTQGFIASNDKGKTVLLGRGGSDVSASYFAAKLSAKRLEIWTDVPGLFTADPRYIGKTRLLKHLNYDEAQEIVTLGAKVLHPRSVTPVKQYHIPLHIRSTLSPEMSGTIISVDAISQGAEVKAISSRKGITVVSMNTIEMWQRVGFLADVFTTFRKHGLSIDLVSTSETNVTVTLDQTTGAFDDKVLKALTKDLSKLCDPRIIPSCATVSLVGNNIRTILHHLAPTLEVFEEKQIYQKPYSFQSMNQYQNHQFNVCFRRGSGRQIGKRAPCPDFLIPKTGCSNWSIVGRAF